MKICGIDGCSNKHLAKGMCRKHYLRIYKNGTLDLTIRRDLCTVDRLKTKIKVTEGGCWLYTAKLTKKGYAHVQDKCKMRFAHVIMYEHIFGKVPEGLELDHLCRNRNCINPEHLEPVTHQENCRRGISGHDFEIRERDERGRFNGKWKGII